MLLLSLRHIFSAKLVDEVQCVFMLLLFHFRRCEPRHWSNEPWSSSSPWGSSPWRTSLGRCSSPDCKGIRLYLIARAWGHRRSPLRLKVIDEVINGLFVLTGKQNLLLILFLPDGLREPPHERLVTWRLAILELLINSFL